MSNKKKKVFGLLVLSVGIGVLLAVMVPLIGWILLSAIALIVAGIYLYRCWWYMDYDIIIVKITVIGF